MSLHGQKRQERELEESATLLEKKEPLYREEKEEAEEPESVGVGAGGDPSFPSAQRREAPKPFNPVSPCFSHQP